MEATNRVRIGYYGAGLAMYVPRSELKDIAGKVAYFREFGSMLVYVGFGEKLRRDRVNCPVHPSAGGAKYE